MYTVHGTFVTPTSLLCTTPSALNAKAGGVDLTVWVDGIQASLNTTTIVTGGVGGNAVEFTYTTTSYNLSSYNNYNSTSAFYNISSYNNISSFTSTSTSSLNTTNDGTALAIDRSSSPYPNPTSLSSLKVLSIGVRVGTTRVGGPSTVGGVQYQQPPHVAFITPSSGR